MKTNALQRLMVVMSLTAAIYVPVGLWVASHMEPAPKTIATAHQKSVKPSLRGAQASLHR